MSLSGRWIGQYRYPDASDLPELHFPQDPVDFVAQITDQGSGFLGEISEIGAPDSFLRGTKEGASITFSKRYSDTGGGLYVDRIIYQGGLNEDTTRIDGFWHIPRLEGFSGAFFMMREKPKPKEVARPREAEVL
jgi:hypothetical protein